MDHIFYILLGLLPSLIWLSFYLRKDKNPEPNSLVIKMFLIGMLLGPLAIVFELALIWLMSPNTNPIDFISLPQQASLIKIVLASTLIPALVEEYLKYSAVKFKIIRNTEFDEPVDAMIYLIIVGLGFAAIENLLTIFNISSLNITRALTIIGLRFLGATLVHALACAIIGYWLAKAILHLDKKKRFIAIGLSIAIAFHAFYNYLIIKADGIEGAEGRMMMFLIIACLMITTALVVSHLFKKIKKEQSICKIIPKK